jgi:hypothetical protein
MSLKETKKEFSIAGKGHNVLLEVINAVKHTSVTFETVGDHVPENGGTCDISHFVIHAAQGTNAALRRLSVIEGCREVHC